MAPIGPQRPPTHVFIPSRFDSASASQDPNTHLRAEHIDIWEHAATLAHAYEWQAAVDAFVRLSRDIEDPELRSRCCINAALIQAWLGDLKEADTTLAACTPTEETRTLATFLVGLIANELHDAARAEGCFDLCFDELKVGAIDYKDAGLEFVLDQNMVHGNLRAVREAEFRARVTGSHIAPMDGLPADCIFEAPQKPTSSDAVKVARAHPERTFSEDPEVGEVGMGRRRKWLESLTTSPKSPRSPAETRSSRDRRASWWNMTSRKERETSESSSLPPSRPVYVTQEPRHGALTASIPTNFRVTQESIEAEAHITPSGQSDLNTSVTTDSRGECEPVQQLERFLNTYLPQETPDGEAGPLCDIVRTLRALSNGLSLSSNDQISLGSSQSSKNSQISGNEIRCLKEPEVRVTPYTSVRNPADTSMSSVYESLRHSVSKTGVSSTGTATDESTLLRPDVYTPPSCPTGIEICRRNVTASMQWQREYTLRMLEGVAGPQSIDSIQHTLPQRFHVHNSGPAREMMVADTSTPLSPVVSVSGTSPIQPSENQRGFVRNLQINRQLPLNKPLPRVPPSHVFEASGASRIRTSVSTECFFEAVVGRTT